MGVVPNAVVDAFTDPLVLIAIKLISCVSPKFLDGGSSVTTLLCISQTLEDLKMQYIGT